MYIAAHPDDENTAVLAYLANERKVRTAYLSLTRGDGGQNRIGSEKGPMLGMIRTEELLNARRIDGAMQFFTRAIDFGYSKTSKESLAFWNHQEVLADVVFAIRQFRPDILITRFTDEFGGHGQHLASAILAHEAFLAAGQPDKFPEQLSQVKVWQPTRLYWNAWSQALQADEKASDLLASVDVGLYNPLKGQTYTEIAAISRSQHRCQGFGASPRRESQVELFQLSAGKVATTDILDGIETDYSKLPGNTEIAQQVNTVQSRFNSARPFELVPSLAKLYNMIDAQGNSHWHNIKKDEVRRLIVACSGLWYQATANRYTVVPGDSLTVNAKIVARTDLPMRLVSLQLTDRDTKAMAVPLEKNVPFRFQDTLRMNSHLEITNPYWLQEPPNGNLFTVSSQADIGLPQKAGPLKMIFQVEIDNVRIELETPIAYTWTDPQRGERWRDIEIVPPISVLAAESQYLFADDKAQEMIVTVLSHQQNVKGKLVFPELPGWKIAPRQIDLITGERGSEQRFRVQINPPDVTAKSTLIPFVQLSGNAYGLPARTLNRIDYDHIPTRIFQPPLEVELIKVDIEAPPRKIAYIVGSGDEVPQALQRMGYQPDIIEPANITPELLGNYDVVITGVRAYNVHAEMAAKQDYLLKFVHDGGTLLVQYNTAHRLVVESPGPYPIKLSRFRVTDEEAAVRILLREHPILSYPNQITAKDFEGWVQERGLYFAGEWDQQYQPILGSNDLDEPSRDGGLLVAHYGQGLFIYTGYSWFRQLPAGVSGAYRLFCNLLNASQ